MSWYGSVVVHEVVRYGVTCHYCHESLGVFDSERDAEKVVERHVGKHIDAWTEDPPRLNLNDESQPPRPPRPPRPPAGRPNTTTTLTGDDR